MHRNIPALIQKNISSRHKEIFLPDIAEYIPDTQQRKYAYSYK